MEERYKKLKEGFFIRNASQSVFVIIYSRKKEKISKSITREIPGILTIFRSDGRIGIPGGRLEYKDLVDCKVCNESLKNTAIRELKEEIGYEIKNPERLKFESSLLYGENQITTYSYLVSDEELNEIYKNYNNVIGSYYNDKEIFGLMRLYLSTDSVKDNIMKQNFKSSVRGEILNIMNKYF